MITGDMTGGLSGASAPYSSEQIKIATTTYSGEAPVGYIKDILYGKDTEIKDLNEAQKQNLSNLAQIASGLAVASVGGSVSVSDVGAAVAGFKNAVENNGLAKTSFKGLEKGYESYMKNAICRNGLAQLGINFGLINDQIQEAMDVGNNNNHPSAGSESSVVAGSPSPLPPDDNGEQDNKNSNKDELKNVSQKWLDKNLNMLKILEFIEQRKIQKL